jgi:hypothetical protein
MCIYGRTRVFKTSESGARFCFTRPAQLAEAGDQGIVAKTHQQLALDLGSVREVISRYLGEWERVAWVRASRGSIEVARRSS